MLCSVHCASPEVICYAPSCFEGNLLLALIQRKGVEGFELDLKGTMGPLFFTLIAGTHQISSLQLGITGSTNVALREFSMQKVVVEGPRRRLPWTRPWQPEGRSRVRPPAVIVFYDSDAIFIVPAAFCNCLRDSLFISKPYPG